MENNQEKKFWLYQKKVYASAITIIALATAFTTYISAKDSVKARVKEMVVVVADSLDNCQVKKRIPLDSQILTTLGHINKQLMKNSYITEKSMTPDKWKQIEAAWKEDSLRFKIGCIN